MNFKQLNEAFEAKFTPEEMLNSSEEELNVASNENVDGESYINVMNAYQSANKWLDSVKEYLYTDLSCPFFSSFVHKLAHSMPERFDKFGDILHTANIKVPYPTTPELDDSRLNSIDDVFGVIFETLDTIKNNLNTFIKAYDESNHGMACAAEGMLNDIESEYPMIYRLKSKWEQCDGNIVEFDKYVMQYVTHKGDLVESRKRKLNEGKKPSVISYSDYKQDHNAIADMNTKNAPVEISEEHYKEQLRDVGKPELIGDAEDFFKNRQSKFAIVAHTDPAALKKEKAKRRNKNAISNLGSHRLFASAEDELDEDWWSSDSEWGLWYTLTRLSTGETFVEDKDAYDRIEDYPDDEYYHGGPSVCVDDAVSVVENWYFENTEDETPDFSDFEIDVFEITNNREKNYTFNLKDALKKYDPRYYREYYGESLDKESKLDNNSEKQLTESSEENYMQVYLDRLNELADENMKNLQWLDEQ